MTSRAWKSRRGASVASTSISIGRPSAACIAGIGAEHAARIATKVQRQRAVMDEFSSDSFLFGTDGLARDDEVVEIKVEVLGRGRGPAVVDIDPDRLDLERHDVAEADVGLLVGGLAVDPASKDAIGLRRPAVGPGRIELAVLLDAIPPSVLERGLELPDVPVLPLHVCVV